MRDKYRSAVYAMKPQQIADIEHFLSLLQSEFATPLITQAYLFNQFKPSESHCKIITIPTRNGLSAKVD